MNLELKSELAAGYKSPLQVARVISEDWAARNLYCPACESDRLDSSPPNARAIDLLCPECNQVYQLKSTKSWSQNRIVDAAYSAMIAAIRSDQVPNLVIMQYTVSWRVCNVLLVPSFFFTESVIERRKPLGPYARRAGWVGCNILLNRIPPDGKLPLVTAGVIADARAVRQRYDQTRPLQQMRGETRGWTLDVLNVVRELNQREFTLQEIYAFEARLAELHPDNRNVRPKIRQRLQKLRDLNFLEFVSPGCYRLT